MDLSTLRDRIDVVDRQIIALLAERLKIVEEVALAKLDSASPFRDREREERLLLRLREHATAAALDPHQVERLYRVVMDMSVAHQEATVRNRADVPLRIAYQGVEGSYSHLTAQRRYGSAYASIVTLGKAVPPGREVPSLIYELAQATNQRHQRLGGTPHDWPRSYRNLKPGVGNTSAVQ